MTRILQRPLFAHRRRGWLVLAVGAATLVAGCNKTPTGQVVATVNGDEVTLTELNAELAAAQIPPGADKKTVQTAALQRIVERKLLADAARQDGIDQSPDYIVRRQRLDEALLVQMLAKKVAGGLKTPAPAAVDKFQEENPTLFAGRTIYAVDQIQFATPQRDDYLKQLSAAKTMSDVVATLDRLQIKYDRQNAQMDSAQVPPPMMTQISKVPSGEPFVIPMGPKIVVGVITGSKAMPATGDQVRAFAANAVKNNQLGQALQQRLTAEKAKAKIEYQPGFSAPSAAPVSPKPADGAPGL